MPMNTHPLAYSCDKCGWRKVVVTKSDCIVIAPPNKCPKCKNQKISVVKSNTTEQMVEKLLTLMLGRN